MGAFGISITLGVVGSVLQLKLLVSCCRWLPQLWELSATGNSIWNGGYPRWTFSFSFNSLHSRGTSLLAATCGTSPTFPWALKVEEPSVHQFHRVWFFHFRYAHLLSWYQPSYLRKQKPSTWSKNPDWSSQSSGLMGFSTRRPSSMLMKHAPIDLLVPERFPASRSPINRILVSGRNCIPFSVCCMPFECMYHMASNFFLLSIGFQMINFPSDDVIGCPS